MSYRLLGWISPKCYQDSVGRRVPCYVPRGGVRVRLRSSSTAPAGGGKVLKVGRAGPNSVARFTSQHYSPGSARSTLAGSIIRYPIRWPWLGITTEDAASIRSWMTANLDRLHISIRQPSPELLTTVELHVRARIGSLYEESP
jgi:hypothetical protein